MTTLHKSDDPKLERGLSVWTWLREQGWWWGATELKTNPPTIRVLDPPWLRRFGAWNGLVERVLAHEWKHASRGDGEHLADSDLMGPRIANGYTTDLWNAWTGSAEWRAQVRGHDSWSPR